MQNLIAEFLPINNAKVSIQNYMHDADSTLEDSVIHISFLQLIQKKTEGG